MVLTLSVLPGQVITAMNIPPVEADPTALFSIAISLRKACLERETDDPDLSIGGAYKSWDQFTRELMRVATVFERWAYEHVSFPLTWGRLGRVFWRLI